MAAIALSSLQVAGRSRTEPASELERRLYAAGVKSIYRLWVEMKAEQPEGEKKYSYSNIRKLVTTKDDVVDSKVLPKIIAKIEEYERQAKKKKRAG